MFTAVNVPAPSVIFENDKIKITTTGRDYDFIATVSNLTNYPIIITFIDNDFEPITVAPSDWLGLLSDDAGRAVLEEMKACRFTVDELRIFFYNNLLGGAGKKPPCAAQTARGLAF